MSHRPHAITGDRPTGPLHLGHYVGSLRARLDLQHTHALTVLVADHQALTDNAHNPQKVRTNITEVMKDYIAIGLDPGKVRFVLQSAVQPIYELAMHLQNVVTVAYVERNPTVRQEIVQRNMARDIPLGFLCYPVSQAADIIGLGGGLVPVGADQLPMIELTNTLIDRLNHQAGREIVGRATAHLSSTSRLVGTDGQAKMSKSLGNSIALSASPTDLHQAVMSMFTDPNHLKVSDPGQVEGNVVFAYLDAFDPDVTRVAELKAHYQRGGLGDVTLKKHLLSVLTEVLDPIRARRADLKDEDMLDLLRQGSRHATQSSQVITRSVRSVFGVLDL